MYQKLYALITDLAAPFIGLYMRRRRARGREDGERFAERSGFASRPRPEGRLVWCHAASVGEAASLLLLINRLHDIYPDLTILLTTGTVTAARLVGSRLPVFAFHQYVPVDRRVYVRRFLDHWQPQLAIWIESELWPNLLAELKARAIPVVLLNARMSEKSFRSWHRVKSWSQEILSAFHLCLAQTEDDRGRFIALGASPVKVLGNLKYAALPLHYDAREAENLRAAFNGRPVWLMASTHRGEEQMALSAHARLIEKFPDLLLILVPRHAVRGDEIAQLINKTGLKAARRSQRDTVQAEAQVYLADTMGELGLFYHLSPITVIGGSFARRAGIAGHNPVEPAQLGSAVILGPYMQNFAGIAREFLAAQAAVQLKHDNEIAFTVASLLSAPAERDRYTQAARVLADNKRHIIDQIVAELRPWLATAI